MTKSKSTTPNLDQDMLKGLLQSKTNTEFVIQSKEESGEVILPSDERVVQLNTKIRSKLKLDLKIYCVKKEIDQKDFIESLISKAIY